MLSIVLACLLVFVTVSSATNLIIHARNTKTYVNEVDGLHRAIEGWKSRALNAEKAFDESKELNKKLLAMKVPRGILIGSEGLSCVEILKDGSLKIV